jgi:exodeoxyribonuclease VII large subunit
MPVPSSNDLPSFSDTPASAGRGGDVPRNGARDVITVTELNRRARQLLESGFQLLWVAGELSNVLRAASGHWYFSLKDKDAQVRCVMFRQRAAAVGFAPENGMQVEVRATPSLYEPRGEFQLGVESMRRAGLGALFEAFEQLKAKLQGEGLFAVSRKRPLAPFPQSIGVITSLKAAALRDVLTTLRRRAPMVEVVVYPTAVQGAGAGKDIAAAIDSARMRREVTTLIICRGGGSIEDLWSFNEEVVVRAIVRLQDTTSIPVISGVGHETDFTICDFVADHRAPTPTAAAEMASPDVVELRVLVAAKRAALYRALRRQLDAGQQRLDRIGHALVSPAERLHRERDRLALQAARNRHALSKRLEAAAFSVGLLRQRLRVNAPDIVALRAHLLQLRARADLTYAHAAAQRASRIEGLRRAFSHLDPARVLDRGYSIVEHHGKVLRDAAIAAAGDPLRVRLARGMVLATVTATADTAAATTPQKRE